MVIRTVLNDGMNELKAKLSVGSKIIVFLNEVKPVRRTSKKNV